MQKVVLLERQRPNNDGKDQFRPIFEAKTY